MIILKIKWYNININDINDIILMLDKTLNNANLILFF